MRIKRTLGVARWKPLCAAKTPLISTAALLDIVRVPTSTGTARRLAAVMRDLHFTPIKSRRLMPGGRTGNTVTRGWGRPIRGMKLSPTIKNAGAAGFNQQGVIP